MQTHEDAAHQRLFMDQLRKRADESKERGDGRITAGAPGEKPICQWTAENGLYCKHMPPDPQGILRISIGGGEHLPVTLNYLTVRGPVGECIALLEKALAALRECPE